VEEEMTTRMNMKGLAKARRVGDPAYNDGLLLDCG